MPETFGARLRRQREERGIALEALARQTRIKASLLEALERDDLSQWPSGFYRRAFFRAYASAIELDPDAAFREFQQLYPEAPADDVLAAMAATLGVDAGRSRSGIRGAVESAFGSLARLRPAPPAEPPPAAEAAPLAEPGPPPVDLAELARLCVELGCVTTEHDLQALLQDAARLLGAAGLIVWVLNSRELQLQATLVHGYPPRVAAQLPMVRRADNNATAEAFRTMQTRVINDTQRGKSALAVPLRTASGCVGVFAVELDRGLEPTDTRAAVATVLAAQLAPIAASLSRAVPSGLPRSVHGEAQTV